jgi:hypothetical protein
MSCCSRIGFAESEKAKNTRTTRHASRLSQAVQKLARFWNSHDLTDFESELEEVTERAFDRATVVRIHLSPAEARKVGNMAKARHVVLPELIRQWVLEKIQSSKLSS